jgi:PTH1 family peptidyl-tRNA hydrolase
MLWLVVGLGNPGKKYEHTRHNVGQEAVDELSRRLSVSLREGRDKALVGEASLRDSSGNDHKVVLAVPTTFMNESGQAVRLLMKRHNVNVATDIERLIIVHDELDLEPGIVRVKMGGGLAGHNGLRSITSHLSTQEYVRVRIGVGKPASAELGADHVLRKVPPNERGQLVEAIGTAADAVESIIINGSAVAMNTFNTAKPS